MPVNEILFHKVDPSLGRKNVGLRCSMEIFSFHTINGTSEGLYKELGSKFLAFAFPVESEEEIKTHLDTLRKKYHDARHHCFAWILGADKNKYRASDDGEPNHSAGDPILGQIKSKSLTNVLVVVVRYFGGVKLGVGGLIQAYKTAAEDALNNAVIIEREVTYAINLLYPYEETTVIQRLIKDFDLKIEHQHFVEQCTLSARVTAKMKESLLSKLELLQATGHSISQRLENC